jgi:hypothetical protein
MRNSILEAAEFELGIVLMLLVGAGMVLYGMNESFGENIFTLGCDAMLLHAGDVLELCCACIG